MPSVFDALTPEPTPSSAPAPAPTPTSGGSVFDQLPAETSPVAPKPWQEVAAGPEWEALDPDKQVEKLGEWTKQARDFAVSQGADPQATTAQLASFLDVTAPQLRQAAEEKGLKTWAQKLEFYRDNPEGVTASDLSDIFSPGNWNHINDLMEQRHQEFKNVRDDASKSAWDKTAAFAGMIADELGLFSRGVFGRKEDEIASDEKGREARTFIGDLKGDKAVEALRNFQKFTKDLREGRSIVSESDARGGLAEAVGVVKPFSKSLVEHALTLKQGQQLLDDLRSDDRATVLSAGSHAAITSFANGIPGLTTGAIAVDEKNPEQVAKGAALTQAINDVLQKDYHKTALISGALGSVTGFMAAGVAGRGMAGAGKGAAAISTEAAAAATARGEKLGFGLFGADQSLKKDDRDLGVIQRLLSVAAETGALVLSEKFGDALGDKVSSVATRKLGARAGLAGDFGGHVIGSTLGEVASDAAQNVLEGKSATEGIDDSLLANSVVGLGFGALHIHDKASTVRALAASIETIRNADGATDEQKARAEQALWASMGDDKEKVDGLKAAVDRFTTVKQTVSAAQKAADEATKAAEDLAAKGYPEASQAKREQAAAAVAEAEAAVSEAATAPLPKPPIDLPKTPGETQVQQPPVEATPASTPLPKPPVDLPKTPGASTVTPAQRAEVLFESATGGQVQAGWLGEDADAFGPKKAWADLSPEQQVTAANALGIELPPPVKPEVSSAETIPPSETNPVAKEASTHFDLPEATFAAGLPSFDVWAAGRKEAGYTENAPERYAQFTKDYEAFAARTTPVTAEATPTVEAAPAAPQTQTPPVSPEVVNTTVASEPVTPTEPAPQERPPTARDPKTGRFPQAYVDQVRPIALERFKWDPESKARFERVLDEKLTDDQAADLAVEWMQQQVEKGDPALISDALILQPDWTIEQAWKAVKYAGASKVAATPALVAANLSPKQAELVAALEDPAEKEELTTIYSTPADQLTDAQKARRKELANKATEYSRPGSKTISGQQLPTKTTDVIEPTKPEPVSASQPEPAPVVAAPAPQTQQPKQSRDERRAWVDSTHQALVEELAKVGVKPEDVGLTPAEMEKKYAEVMLRANGRELAADAALAEVRNDLLRNARVAKNPFIATSPETKTTADEETGEKKTVNVKSVVKVDGDGVPTAYDATVVIRRVVGNLERKLKREMSGDSTGEGKDGGESPSIIDNATSASIDATSGVAPGNKQRTADSVEKERVLRELLPALGQIVDGFAASFDPTTVGVKAGPDVVQKAAQAVIENIVRDREREGAAARIEQLNTEADELQAQAQVEVEKGTEASLKLSALYLEAAKRRRSKAKSLSNPAPVGLVETRGSKGAAHTLASNPDFQKAVRAQVFEALEAMVKEQTDETVLLADAIDDLTEQQKKDELEFLALSVANGFLTPENALAALSDPMRTEAQRRVADFKLNQGTAAMLQVIARKAKDPLLKQLAVVLANSAGARNVKITADISLSARGAQGHYVPATASRAEFIGLNPLRDSDEEFMSTALHEVSHSIAYAKIEAFFDPARRGELSARDTQTLTELEVIRASILAHPLVPAAIRTIAETSKSQAELMRRFNALKMDGKGTYYGLISMHEFTSKALTSRKFQAFLNSMPVDDFAAGTAPKGKTIWQKVKALLRKLVFGAREVREDSALAHVFDRTIDLLQGEVAGKAASTAEADAFADASEGEPLPLPKSDQLAQVAYLNQFAKEHGYEDMQDLLVNDMALFQQGAFAYRASNPRMTARQLAEMEVAGYADPVDSEGGIEAMEFASNPLPAGAEQQGPTNPMAANDGPRPVFDPSVATSESRKYSEGLARARREMPAPIRRALTEQTYIAGKNPEDLDKANEFIASRESVEEAFYAARRESDSTPFSGNGLTETQRTLVGAAALQRISLAHDILATDIASGRRKITSGDMILAEHYRELAAEVGTWVRERLTNAAQELQIGNVVADLFSPRTYAETEYKRPVKQAQSTALKNNRQAGSIRGMLTGAQKAASAATIKSLKDLLEKAARIGTPAAVKDQQEREEAAAAQAVFDFFADASTTNQVTGASRRQGYVQQDSPLPLMEQIKEAVKKSTAVSVVTQLRKLVGTDPLLKQNSYLQALESSVASLVNEQINSRLNQLQTEKPEMTREQQLAAIGDIFQRMEVAEAVFGRMQRAISDYASTQPDDFRYALQSSGLLGASFDVERVNKLRSEVRKLVDLPKVIRASLTSRYTTLASLQSDIRAANPSMTDAQAAALANAVEKTFNAEVERASKAFLEGLVASDKAVAKRLDTPTIQRLVEMVNIGAFQEEQFYNVLAPKFNLPAWDETFATAIENRVRSVQRLPEGSIQRNEAMQQIMLDVLTKHRETATGGTKFRNALDLTASLWTAGVLSGPPTHFVNTVMTGASVLLEGVVAAAGYAVAARKAGHKGTTRQFLGDVARAYTALVGAGDGLSGKLKSAAALEAYAALAHGSTRFKSEKLEDLSVLEQFKAQPFEGAQSLTDPGWWWSAVKATPKFVGRAMLAADGVNSLIAANMKQVMAARYEAMNSGLIGDALDKHLETVLDSDGAAREAATQQADQEKAEGQFGTLDGLTPGTARYKAKAREIEVTRLRRIEQLVENATTAQEVQDKGRDFAKLATFNNDPYGVVGFALGLISQFNSATGVTKPLVPFPRTLSNLVNASINYSPIGVLRAHNLSVSRGIAGRYNPQSALGQQARRYVTPEIEAGSPEYWGMMSRAVFGTVAFTVLAAAVKASLGDDEDEKWFEITARGPSDPAKAKQLKEAGLWEENTIKLGDVRLKYTDWPALNIMLGALGAFSDAVRFNAVSEKDAENLLGIASLSVVNVIIDKNMLSGLSELFKAMDNPDAVGLNSLKKLAGSYAGGIAHPQLLRWVERSFLVNEKGMVEVPEQTTFQGWLYGMSPVAALHERKSLNILGEPIQLFPWEATARRFGSMNEVVKPHPILTPLVKAGLFLPPPDKSTKLPATIEKPKGEKMTDEQFYDYSRHYGEQLRKMLTPETVEMLAAEASRSPEAREQVQQLLNSTMGEAAREYARSKVAPTD